MALAPGTRLGPYQIAGQIGAGGMGEVYEARDTRLDRTVAIKVLAPEFSGDAGRRSRFEREARAIASLTHPNICTLHDVGDHEGTAYLVMERLEGETLAARIARGPMPIPAVVAFATQIADGLARAHREGIVHRDLKPANVMLTRSGVKLLDFGLAKLVSKTEPVHDARTKTSPLTTDGELLGTIPYMAPEQLEGKAIDARTDVFAFGAILYEMVTGQRAFDGASQATLIGNILHSTPRAMSQLRPGVPPPLEHLITVCLSKDPVDRWSTAHDVLLQLKGTGGGPVAATAATGAVGSRERLAWSIATLTGVSALVLAGVLFINRTSPSPTDNAVDLVPIVAPDGTTFVRGEGPAISPDGRHVAFIAIDRAGTRGLYVRSRDTMAPRFIVGTEDASQPFWAPDSKRLGFFAQGQVKTVALAGGSPAAIGRAPLPRGGTWSKDDLIMFSPRPNVALVYVPATGGQPTSVKTGLATELGIPGFPSFLPDGRHYLFTELDPATHLAAHISYAAIDEPGSRQLVATTSSGAYAANHLLFRQGTTLMAQPFNPATGQLSGHPMTVAENVGFTPITYQALFSAAASGAIAYQDAQPRAELVWFSRDGTRLASAAPPGEYNTFCMTLDGGRLVYDRADEASGHIDVWTLDLHTSVSSQLTFGGPVAFYPTCSPNGEDIAFASLKPSTANLYRQSLRSPGKDTPLSVSPVTKVPTDWSRDGRTIVYSEMNPARNWDVLMMPADGGPARELVATPAEERNGKLSPDGRFVAYASNENGRFNVYVQPVPTTGTKWAVSKDGGRQPQWSVDGKQLYYIAPDRKLIAVDVNIDGTALRPGAPTSLMDTKITEWEPSNQGNSYAVAPDGKRVLISTATNEERAITLMLNWTAVLKP